MIQHIEDPDEAEVVVVKLSPTSLMTKNRYVCEVCKKGFQRDQNLQLHRRGHNLPWKLKTTKSDTRKRVYLCPEETCPHHFRSRALGDMTGIKKHYLRKHCPKMYKCPKCSKLYAVLSDLKAHLKTCGKNKYRCDCGLIYGRRDTFRTHKAFCEVLAAETERVTASHPRLETSSEDSGNGTMPNFSQGDISPPPGFEHIHRHHLNNHPSGFHHHQLPASGSEPRHHHQLNDAPPPGFTSINHRHLQFTEPDLSSTLGYTDGTLILNFSNNTVVKKESNIVDKNNHAFHFPADFMATAGNYSYTMNQPTTLQSYQQRKFMNGGGSDVDMIGSTGMSQLHMGESSGHSVAPPVNYYYYNLLMEDEKEPPTRDFLGLSMGNGGRANSTSMDDFIVALGGATNVNLDGYRGCGGGGVNVYSEEREWENDGHVNAHQMYGFSGGASSSRI
ncbi:hypothetical protein Leryth_016291 [Lithospermum erythrorhizon]|nr:hypothetical protein Leryth_016291 [Lithospermum erythrorhizon]